MTLTERFFATFGFIQLIGILAMWKSELLALYILLVVGMLYVVWRDLKMLADESDLSVAVTGPKRPSLGQTVKFSVDITARTPRSLAQYSIRALALRTEMFEFLKPSLLWRSGDAQPIEHSAQVLQLGHVHIDHWPIAVLSPRRFFRRIVSIPIEPVECRIAPEHAKLSEQAFAELLQSQPLLWQGARLRTRSNEQDQVLSIRKYQYPDPLRHIDQKKSARFHEPMTRTFDTLRNHHLIIALDVGRALSGTIRQSAKVDYYLSAALALAENAIKSRDQVSFFAFSQTTQMVIRNSRSLRAFHSLFRSDKVFRARDEESDYRLIPSEIARLTGTRAIVVILTDQSRPSVQEGLLAAIAPVCRRHLAVVAGLNDRELDLEKNVSAFKALPESAGFKNMYSDLIYSYWMREKHLLFKEKLARLGAGSLSVNDAHWMTTVERLYGLLRASRLA